MSGVLQPGQSRDFFLDVPDDKKPVALAVRFTCNDCGTEHTHYVGLTGGTIVADCPCGAELRLKVSTYPDESP